MGDRLAMIDARVEKAGIRNNREGLSGKGKMLQIDAHSASAYFWSCPLLIKSSSIGLIKPLSSLSISRLIR